MALKFTNTLTGCKEPFEPIHPQKVTLYVCGVTVYDDAHIGHVRGAVVFDVLRRTLEHRGFEVVHVRNITDVDDKIIDRARQMAELSGDLKAKTRAVAERYTRSFQNDFSRLNLLPPTHEPKATEYISKTQAFIGQLLDRGMAYLAADGVYFSVRKLQGRYGVLSNQKLDEMQTGESGAGEREKQDPLDFALWKQAKPEEPSWDSPWGPGRPGWHIECSTMSTDLLGDQFDIHGGGRDLIFPHHENELAQAKGVDKPFAKLWLHNGLLTVGGQKMSKSLGNIVTVGAVLKKYSADVLRYFFLSAQYGSPMDFTFEHLDTAGSAYIRILDFLNQVEQLLALTDVPAEDFIREAREQFLAAMDDDLNTPQALAVLHSLINRSTPLFREALSGQAQAACNLWAGARLLRELTGILGLTFFRIAELPEAIHRLKTAREAARKNKDFEQADALRKAVKAAGFVMEDTGGGTVVMPDV